MNVNSISFSAQQLLFQQNENQTSSKNASISDTDPSQNSLNSVADQSNASVRSRTTISNSPPIPVTANSNSAPPPEDVHITTDGEVFTGNDEIENITLDADGVQINSAGGDDTLTGRTESSEISMGSGFTQVELDAADTNVTVLTGGSEVNVRGNSNNVIANSVAGDITDSITVAGINNTVVTGDADAVVTIKAASIAQLESMGLEAAPRGISSAEIKSRWYNAEPEAYARSGWGATVDTGAGNDVINYSGYGSVVKTNDGDDQINIVKGENSIFDTGAGHDTVDIKNSAMIDIWSAENVSAEHSERVRVFGSGDSLNANFTDTNVVRVAADLNEGGTSNVSVKNAETVRYGQSPNGSYESVTDIVHIENVKDAIIDLGSGDDTVVVSGVSNRGFITGGSGFDTVHIPENYSSSASFQQLRLEPGLKGFFNPKFDHLVIEHGEGIERTELRIGDTVEQVTFENGYRFEKQKTGSGDDTEWVLKRPGPMGTPTTPTLDDPPR